MKSAWICPSAVLLVACPSVWASASTVPNDGVAYGMDRVSAQETPPTGTGSAQEPLAGEDESRRPEERKAANDARLRRYIVQLIRLQKAVKRKLTLTRGQERAVDQLFTEYIRSLRDAGRRRRSSGLNHDDAAELAELRARLREARRNGDEEAVRQIRERFRERIRASRDAVSFNLTEFISKVSAELTDEQRPLFRKLVKAMRIGRVKEGFKGEGLRRLWQVVMDRDTGLSNAQRRAVNGIIREGIAAVTQAERDGSDAEEIVARVRAEVLDQLTRAQRARVEAVLNSQARREHRRRGPRLQERDRYPEHREVDVNADQDTPETGGAKADQNEQH